MRSIFATPQFRKDLVEVSRDIFTKTDAVLSVLKLNPVDVSLKSKIKNAPCGFVTRGLKG